MFKIFVLAKSFLAHFANVYNIKKWRARNIKKIKAVFLLIKKKGNLIQNENLKLSF